MGILDSLQQLAGQAGLAAQGDQAKVAGGFIEALTQHPEGIEGILNAMKSNGLADHVGAWANGQAQEATPEQIQQGLGSTGLIEQTAQSAGVSSSAVTSALAVILPMVIQHFAPNGQAAESSNFGSLAQMVLGKLL
ncbi:MAG TPA: YidB family protein [Edaphobacter sp.]